MWTKTANELPAAGKAVIAYVTNAYGNGKTRRVLAFYASKKFLEMHEDWEDDESCDFDEKSGFVTVQKDGMKIRYLANIITTLTAMSHIG